jgi:hypothetical protein
MTVPKEDADGASEKALQNGRTLGSSSGTERLSSMPSDPGWHRGRPPWDSWRRRKGSKIAPIAERLTVSPEVLVRTADRDDDAQHGRSIDELLAPVASRQALRRVSTEPVDAPTAI